MRICLPIILVLCRRRGEKKKKDCEKIFHFRNIIKRCERTKKMESFCVLNGKQAQSQVVEYFRVPHHKKRERNLRSINRKLLNYYTRADSNLKLLSLLATEILTIRYTWSLSRRKLLIFKDTKVNFSSPEVNLMNEFCVKYFRFTQAFILRQQQELCLHDVTKKSVR